MGDIPKVDMSYLENISEPAETLSFVENNIKKGDKKVRPYSGQSDIAGKDLKKQIAIMFDPANIPALEYAGLKVLSKSNNKALALNVPMYSLL